MDTRLSFIDQTESAQAFDLHLVPIPLSRHRLGEEDRRKGGLVLLGHPCHDAKLVIQVRRQAHMGAFGIERHLGSGFRCAAQYSPVDVRMQLLAGNGTGSSPFDRWAMLSRDILS